MVGLISAGRDDAVWPDPASFSLDRAEPAPHLAFGHGIHVCLGATLARLEARTAIGLLLDRAPTLALAPGYRYEKVDGPFNWGPKRLDVVRAAGP